MLRNANGGGEGVSDFPETNRYEGVMFNVISVTRGWVGVQFPEKLRYVTLEWPLSDVITLNLTDRLYIIIKYII